MTAASAQRFDRLPNMVPLMLRAALPGGRGPLQAGATIPRIEAEVSDVAIDGSAVDAYRKVCGFTPGERVPPTWLQVLAGPLHMAILADSKFPLPAMGVVHVSNRIDQYESIRAGERVHLAAWVDGHRPAKRGVQFDLQTEARREGQVLWRSTATVLSMAGHKSGGKKSGAKRDKKAPELGELPGRTHSVIWSVREDQGRRYGQISGDRNPIHLYAITAKAFGFKRAIVHGMWSLARCLAELEEGTPESGVRVDVAFKRPIFLPSSVLFSAANLSSEGAGEGHEFRVATPNGAKPHLNGTILPIPADS